MSGSIDLEPMGHAELLAVCEQLAPWMNGRSAHRVAQAVSGHDADDLDWVMEARSEISRDRVGFWQGELDRLAALGIELVAAGEPGYPTNLSLVHDGPPALFVRGTLAIGDRRSVAIVGTRSASEEGVKLAYGLARSLASDGVTIISGLAKGIDTAAHAGAIAAKGRTIAVFGTPIERVYPAANRTLANSVADHGACVSQFLPGSATGPWAFPARNITTSGLAVGTIVVEASKTSGAKLQAEAALAHGKQVFLVDGLVGQPWAKKMAEDPSVTVSSDPDEILTAVDHLLRPRDGLLV